jgi:hypothetical protein
MLVVTLLANFMPGGAIHYTIAKQVALDPVLATLIFMIYLSFVLQIFCTIMSAHYTQKYIRIFKAPKNTFKLGSSQITIVSVV